MKGLFIVETTLLKIVGMEHTMKRCILVLSLITHPINGQSKSDKLGYKNIVIDLNCLVNNPYYNVTLTDIQNEVNQLGKFNCSTYY